MPIYNMTKPNLTVKNLSSISESVGN